MSFIYVLPLLFMISATDQTNATDPAAPQWVNWIGKPKPHLAKTKGNIDKLAKPLSVNTGGRTDDQWLKLHNGALNFYKDRAQPILATSRPRSLALARR